MVKTTVLFFSAFLYIGSTAAAQTSAPPPATPSAAASSPKLETDDQKTLYALGLLLGRNIKVFSLTPEELAFVLDGLHDSVAGAKPQVELDTYGPKVNDLAQKRNAAQVEITKQKGQEFADKVAAEKDTTKTPSGIVIRVITPGTGDSPTADATVKVNYEGKLVDGTIFDSSIQRGQPVEFPLKSVVPCWTEALQKMTKGEKAQIVCPASLAYGDKGSPPVIPAGATLSFEVELLDFHKP
jgi:FKBP-type peptidyl-prolyl cis-trans isomerase FkpA